MRVQILATPPALPRIGMADGVPNIVLTHGLSGLEVIVDGDGIVDVYTFQEGMWRKHPQGTGVIDDGSKARLVNGDNVMAACLVKDGVVPAETQGFLSACCF